MPSQFFRETLEKISPDTKEFIRIYADILERVHYLLESKGYTQKDLAKSLDKNESEVSKWLNGGHNLTLKSIAKLQVALGEEIIQVKPIPESSEGIWRKSSNHNLTFYAPKRSNSYFDKPDLSFTSVGELNENEKVA
jgi:transcriptional regulator with XRE-family HTH domain